MVVALKNKDKAKSRNNADEIARSHGIKPYDVNEKFEDPEISDEELEEFLKWRREVRKADVEAQKSWQPL